ncbi:DUF4435 domain-containing protein, partial [Vibrio anguillarum]
MANLPVVGLIRLLKAHSSEPDAIICVFEGEDAKYYGARIDSVFKSKTRLNVPCKGNLLSLKKTVESNANLKGINVLYFADRDFDFSDITQRNIYFTPCHSVENFYVNDATFRKILSDEYGICSVNSKKDYDGILEMFNSTFKKLENEIICLNAWIMLQIKLGEKDDSISLNLNNTKITDFVDIELDSIIPKYDLDKLGKMFPNSGEVNDAELGVATNALRDNGGASSCRGKYIIQFMRIFLDKFSYELNNKQSNLVNLNVKPKLMVNDGNILSALS